MKPIYIFGHKNPDTDSICSAIAYSYLKNTQQEYCIPARLGELNRETRFVLETFDIPEPAFLPHLHLRVQDIMTDQIVCAPIDSTIYHVGQLMHENSVHYLPLVDEHHRALGLVTERNLVRAHLKDLHKERLANSSIKLGKIVETLKGKLLIGESSTSVEGNLIIGAMSVEEMKNCINTGDIVVLGHNHPAQEVALRKNASCIILTDHVQPAPHILKMASEQECAIIMTAHDAFTTARLVELSAPAEELLHSRVMTVHPDSLVAEITPELLDSKPNIAFVNDEEGKLIGILTKSDLTSSPRVQVILVDHSERSQSAEGIENAEILEILDHHRLGGLETTGPILAMLAPVGCTATLVLQRYHELGVVPPRAIAGIMLAAILSDTMLLKSPTTTQQDRKAVEELSLLLGEEAECFGKRMYKAKFDLTDLSPKDIITSDFKSFVFGRANVGIGQVEVGDKDTILIRKAEILAEMTRYQLKQGFDLMLLMVTDILLEGTELLVVGKTRFVEWAFDQTLQDHSIYLPGVLSRKKQIVPPILGAVG